jgi:ribosomal protein S8
MKPSALYLLCARLNQAISLKQNFFSFPYSPICLKFLFCLKNNNLIQGYFIERENATNRRTIYIYLIYNNNLALFSHFFIYSSRKLFFSFSCSTLIKFQSTMKNHLIPIFIFQTSKGFLTNFEVIRQKLGGKLIGFIQ